MLEKPTMSKKVMSKKVMSKKVMSKKAVSKNGAQLHRRRFLKTTISATGAAVMAPTIIHSSALGRDGTAPPSERIVMGGIGIGRRGGYDLSCFLPESDVQFVAIADVK
jgi:hypothetical protein